jgi:hypothetical protein
VSIEVTPCGGCGNADPSKVCIGCRHPFYGVKVGPDKNECSPVAAERKAYSDGYNQGYVHGQASKANEIDRLRGAVARIKKLRDDWQKDEQDHLNTWGQHLPTSLVCLVEQLDAALADGEGVGECAVCDGSNKYDPKSGICANCQDIQEPSA